MSYICYPNFGHQTANFGQTVPPDKFLKRGTVWGCEGGFF